VLVVTPATLISDWEVVVVAVLVVKIWGSVIDMTSTASAKLGPICCLTAVCTAVLIVESVTMDALSIS
jgi:hypothetical protein